MSKKKIRNHEEFMEQLKIKNPKVYNDFIIIGNYKNSNNKIEVKGKFGTHLTSPYTMLKGHYPNIDTAINKTQFFKNHYKQKQPELSKEFQIIGDYKGTDVPILTKTKYGEIYVHVCVLFRGETPITSKAVNPTKYFKNILKEKQPYITENFEITNNYINAKTKIILTDGDCDYAITPTALLGGTRPSVQSCLDKTKLFISQSEKVHDCSYLYSKTIYKNNRDLVTITCKIHGDFQLSPAKHKSGRGCQKCATCGNFDKHRWVSVMPKRHNFDGFNLYLIKCSSKNYSEIFYKIGITSKTVNSRFATEEDMPYDYEIIDKFNCEDGNLIWDLEKKLHTHYRYSHYIPKKYFTGSKLECFESVSKYNEIKNKLIIEIQAI